MINEEQQEQLEELVRETIQPALFEDLGIDEDENPKEFQSAITYLVQLLKDLG